jgi:hypothetical protein
VTGYAVGLPHHTTKDGGIVWYGGGKLAADLTLPKLRHRWAEHGAGNAPFPGRGLSAGAARAVLRNIVTGAAEQARDETGFFARLRDTGVLVRARFSEINPGQVTGYSASLPGHVDRDGAPIWYGGGRLSADLTLSRLHCRWGTSRNSTAERFGAFRFTVSERNAIYEHAARQATNAAEHIRHCAHHDPTRRGPRLTPSMSRRRRFGTRRCAERRTVTAARPVRPTAGFPTAPTLGTSCVPLRA